MVAIGGDAAARTQFQTLEVLAGDDVDHAGDRIRAIDGRSAVTQNFDVIDQADRHVLQILALGARDEGGNHALAVNQDKRALIAQPAQVGGGNTAGRDRILIVAGIGLGHRGQALDGFFQGRGLGLGDIVGADDGDRRFGNRVGGRDARTGDDHAFRRLLRLRQGWHSQKNCAERNAAMQHYARMFEIGHLYPL